MKHLISIFLLLVTTSGALAASNIQHYQLKNGLNIYVKVNKRTPIVISQLWYKVGSSDEHNGITGVSHILEHMMFKATNQYPSGAISQFVSSVGGEFNAFTSQDYTVYYEIVPKQYLAKIFWFEAARMQGLQFKPTVFTKELAVVKSEKRMRIDDRPQAFAFNRFLAAAHISNPYHHPIIGWQSDLDHMTINNAKTWYHDYYAPNNAILVVVGDVKPDDVYQLAKQYFSPLQTRRTPTRKPRTEQQHLGNRRVTLHLKTNIPMLIMGYNVPSYLSTDNKQTVAALMVLNSLIGTNKSSVLQNTLIRKQQIAADIGSNYNPLKRYSTTLNIYAYAALNKKLSALRTSIQTQLSTLKEKPVSPSALERAKVQILAQKTYEQDGIRGQANNIGQFEVRNLPYTINSNLYQLVNQVSAHDVLAAARKYLTPSNITTVNVLPLTQAKNS